MDGGGVIKEIVNYEGRFCTGVDNFLEQHEIKNRGFDYTVVTVLGCQSSGKSTLLNRLFGTSFPVMNSSMGRVQTTKGIWLATTPQACVVVDVEGTDSKERGEERLAFEHRSALFSLAVADMVIVNMWHHDIGRYSASNYGLLKTVFGVHLELFLSQKDKQNTPRTALLFVIRDHNEQDTPIQILQEQLYKDIQNIWAEIKKPEEAAKSVASDYFAFAFAGLPSKHDDEGFNRGVDQLLTRWERDLRPKEYTRRIPGDGLAWYMENIWNTILSSPDLDIPSQKQMLSTFRCEDIKAAAFQAALPSILALANTVAHGGEMNRGMFCDVLRGVSEEYDPSACRYEEEVYETKRTQLFEQVFHELQKVIDPWLVEERHRIASDMETEWIQDCTLAGKLDPRSIWETFGVDSSKRREHALASFKDRSDEMVHYTIPNGGPMSLSTDQACIALNEAIVAIEHRIRDQQRSAFRAALVRDYAKEFKGIESLFDTPDLALFWTKISTLTNSAKDKMTAHYSKSYNGIKEESEPLTWELENATECMNMLQEKLTDNLRWVSNHVISRFKSSFELDTDGVPRQWQDVNPEDIKHFYITSRILALELLEVTKALQVDLSIFGDVPLDPSWKGELLSESRVTSITASCETTMRKICSDAQTIRTNGGSRYNIPLWLYGVLIALGWNEIRAVLSSPLLLLMTVFIGIASSVCYVTGNTKILGIAVRQTVASTTNLLVPVLSSINETLTPQIAAAPPKVKEEEE